ncbi:MAG: hypothetical protein ABR898_17435 [Terracidiphilus sp.]|jgi:hypothetical protein
MPASDTSKSKQYPGSTLPLVKVKAAGKHPSEAEANRFLSSIYGTAEAVPFQNQTFTIG